MAQQAEQIVMLADYADEVIDLPLGQVFGVEDEWEGGWGRTAEELEALVRAKCLEQVRW